MKKILTIILLMVCTPLFAIQKSDDINRTVELLRIELDALQRNSPVDLVKFYDERTGYMEELIRTGSKVDELALVMYSQRNHSIFAMAHTCKQVQTLYKEHKSHQYPVEKWDQIIKGEVRRYKKLSDALNNISPDILKEKTRDARQTSLLTCDSIVTLFAKADTVLNSDNLEFVIVSNKIEGLEQYSQEQYEWLKNRIFLDGSTPYLTVLSNLNVHYNLFVDNVDLMLSFYRESRETSFIYLFLKLLRTFLCTIAVIWLTIYGVMKLLSKKVFKRSETRKKLPYYTAILTIILTIISLLIFNINVFEKEYEDETSILLMEYGVTIATILLSITLRLSSKHLRKAFFVYSPILSIAFLPIIYRAILVPNEVVHFTFPPILLITSIIYIIILLKHAYSTSRIDAFYGWLSFAIIAICTVLAWGGYRFMSLQILMLWLTLLSVIQILICIRFFIGRTDRRYHRRHKTENTSWYSKMLNKLILPLLTVTLLVAGCFWAANVFDLSEFFGVLLSSNIIELPKVATFSMSILLRLICIGIIANYFICLIKEILQTIFRERYNESSIPLFISIGTIFAWTIYIATAMYYLQVDYAGVVAILGGLGVGVGFAMKETIDNFICGLSLMMGRLKLGDMIDCDGVRGSVVSIGYRSTLIETNDGSIIAFLNSQLFAKTYRNLTRNHGYELAKVSIGIAYGEDVDKARECILKATQGLHLLQTGKTVSVFLDQFGASSVDLVVILWVPVHGKVAVLSAAKEAIYKSFAENNITIPFPQQDIYLHQE